MLNDPFEAHYRGSYPSMEALITEELRIFGWDTALQRFEREQSLPRGYLSWDATAITAELRERYVITQQDNWTHVFYPSYPPI